jgi:hypothetical protein
METTIDRDHAHRPGIAEARAVTREFLTGALSDVQRLDVTKVAPVASGDATWEAEADVWQPNPTLKSLGLETGRPVLDHSHYLVRLDALLNVLEYELEQTR